MIPKLLTPYYLILKITRNTTYVYVYIVLYLTGSKGPDEAGELSFESTEHSRYNNGPSPSSPVLEEDIQKLLMESNKDSVLEEPITYITTGHHIPTTEEEEGGDAVDIIPLAGDNNNNNNRSSNRNSSHLFKENRIIPPPIEDHHLSQGRSYEAGEGKVEVITISQDHPVFAVGETVYIEDALPDDDETPYSTDAARTRITRTPSGTLTAASHIHSSNDPSTITNTISSGGGSGRATSLPRDDPAVNNMLQSSKKQPPFSSTGSIDNNLLSNNNTSNINEEKLHKLNEDNLHYTTITSHAATNNINNSIDEAPIERRSHSSAASLIAASSAKKSQTSLSNEQIMKEIAEWEEQVASEAAVGELGQQQAAVTTKAQQVKTCCIFLNIYKILSIYNISMLIIFYLYEL